MLKIQLIFALAAYVALISILTAVEVGAFSARLNRPWDEKSMTRRHQLSSNNICLYVSELEKSKSGSNQEEGGEGKDDLADDETEGDDEEESMCLEEPEIPGSSLHVLSSGATVAATTTSSSQSVPSEGMRLRNE